MITAIIKVLGVVLLASKAQIGMADCSNEQPYIESFKFPAYGGIDGGAEGDVFSMSPYRECSTATSDADDFYGQDFPVVYCSDDANCGNYTCAEALELDADTVNSFLQDDAIAVPDGDDAACCGAVRFKVDELIGHEMKQDRCVVINITEEYGTDALEFASICEEYYACNQYVDQYAALKCGNGTECRNMTYPSLCFDEAYGPNDDDGASELNLRTKFIVGSCYGAGEDGFDFEQGSFKKRSSTCTEPSYNDTTATSLGLGLSIVNLQEERDAICQFASDVNNRLTFSLTGADEDLCTEIIDCVVNETNKLYEKGLAKEPTTSDQFDRYDFCNYDTSTELEKARNDTCGGGNSDLQAYNITQGEGGCRTLPSCPAHLEGFFESFSPIYPLDTDYKESLETIVGDFLQNGFTERTTANNVALIGTIRGVTSVVEIITEVFVNALPDDFLYVWKFPPYVIAALVRQAFDAVYIQSDLHDKYVNSAEIEAMYENTRQLLDGSAAIYDEVVCRCSEGPRRGQGCDSVDNNCNQKIDECDEENFPPEIDVAQAIVQCGSGSSCCGKREIWFTSEEDALSCVNDTAEVLDDCDVDLQGLAMTLNSTCYNSTITLDAMDKCNNTASTKLVPVHIDLEDPTVWCEFGGGQQHITIIGESTISGAMKEMNFSYGALDNCGGPLETTVSIFSNEIEPTQTQNMALLYKNTGSPNDQAGLYLEACICSNGRSDGECITEDGFSDYRLYTVVVSAVDPSGRNAQKATCTVLVTKKEDDPVPDISQSSQRFPLAKYTSTFSMYGY